MTENEKILLRQIVELEAEVHRLQQIINFQEQALGIRYTSVLPGSPGLELPDNITKKYKNTITNGNTTTKI